MTNKEILEELEKLKKEIAADRVRIEEALALLEQGRERIKAIREQWEHSDESHEE